MLIRAGALAATIIAILLVVLYGGFHVDFVFSAVEDHLFPALYTLQILPSTPRAENAHPFGPFNLYPGAECEDL
jgi:hypothetical protein